MWGTSHIMRARRWLNLGNVVPIICNQAELILCNMVAPTVPVKSGLGEWEREARGQFPESVLFARQKNVYYSY